MNKTIYMFVLILLTTSPSVWSMDWLPVNTLDNIRINSVGSIYGNTVNAIVRDACNTTNFNMPYTQQGFDAMLSVLLAALAANKQVKLSLLECNSTSNTLVINGVRINR